MPSQSTYHISVCYYALNVENTPVCNGKTDTLENRLKRVVCKQGKGSIENVQEKAV